MHEFNPSRETSLIQFRAQFSSLRQIQMSRAFPALPNYPVTKCPFFVVLAVALLFASCSGALLAAPIIASNGTASNSSNSPDSRSHSLHNRRIISFVPYFSDMTVPLRPESNSKLDAESKLINKWQADPSVGRPRRNHSETLNVTLAFSLFTISEVDEDNEVAVLHGMMEMQWTDDHLKWNKTEFGGLTEVSIPSEMVWKPDITMYNAASHDKTVEIFGATNVHVSESGDVLWSPPSTLHVPLRYVNSSDPWPRDRYEMSVRLGSWSHASTQVNLLMTNESLNASEVMDDYLEGNRWKVLNLTVRPQVESFACCPEQFAMMLIELQIGRKPNFLLHVVDWPLKVVLISTCLIFAVHVSAVALRILIAAVYFIIYVILILVLEEMLPHGAVYAARMPLPVVVVVCAMILLLFDMVWVAVMGAIVQVSQHRRFPQWMLSVVHRTGYCLMLDPRQRGDEQKIALYGRVVNGGDEDELNDDVGNKSTRRPPTTNGQVGTANHPSSARSSPSWATPGDGTTASEADAVRINTSNWHFLAAVLNRIAFLTTLISVFVILALTP